MIYVITPPPVPFWTQTTTLEGAVYVLRFQYNQRCTCWYLHVADASGVDIYNGVKLMCNVSLLRKCADARKPPGILVVRSSTSDQSPPQLNDLATGSGRCKLLYMTSDWVAQVRAGGAAALLASLQTNTTQGTASTYGSGL